ncbi:MAG: DEAD/DEAH box helicase [Mycobacteriales bacterium]|nr:MAG: RNA helicase [Pseudonocardiales bacterium]
MSSPARRYGEARRRNTFPSLTDFAAELDFALDEFQREACESLERGESVLVCAPTGTGKTVVGEFAVTLALQAGRKCFYTTPIKALSNQKYADLVARHGADRIGLLTGDNAINAAAPVVVMTTEVLRNMLYVGSPALDDLGFVVMDEVHYLADRFRGAVWEEVIIHLSDDVRLVSLSATVSNAEEFGDWLVTVRGHTAVVVSEQRPVPLWQHMLVGSRRFDLFADAATLDVDPNLARACREAERRLTIDVGRSARTDHRHRGPARRGYRPPDRATVIEGLDRDGMLPAIDFIFSRGGCEAAVRQCVHAGLRLTTPDEQDEIRAVIGRRTGHLDAADLQVLGFWEWREALQRGIAAHHAGLIPTFKETVEELFVRGLVRVVFATETLALGINMPARSVVLERLVKYNGEAHADLTAGEYTQLTGRAGRRGIDVEGHAVVLWTPGLHPGWVAGLASTRTYPLRSSFRPSYNMAVNLVAQVGRAQARGLLDSSFAQFQADRAVVGLVGQVASNEQELAGYRDSMRCHLGDFDGYAQLRRQLSEREAALARDNAAARRAAAAASLEALQPGDVVRISGGRRAGIAVVIDTGRKHDLGVPMPTVLSIDRRVHRLTLMDAPRPVERLTRLRIPANFDIRSARSRKDLASSLRNLELDLEHGAARRGSGRTAADDDEITELRRALRRHPCHGCAEREEHARWADRYRRLHQDTDVLRTRIESRTHSLARTFDRVCAVLGERGYLAGDSVTPDGERLARIWSECDLLVAECLRARAWDGLDAASLAAVVASLVYEPRRDTDGSARVPGAIAAALAATLALHADVVATEREHRLDRSRDPDLGFCWPAYRWARGESLDHALGAVDVVGEELSAGDFVRWCKQLIDLLDQIADVADGSVAATARQAVDAICRGVVAASSI